MEALIAYLACICILLIFGRLFVIPIKIITKLLFNSFVGIILLYIFNFIGKNYAFHIGINWITAGVCRDIRNSWSNFITFFENFIKLIKQEQSSINIKRVDNNKKEKKQ